jgi:PhzF family phenazine biosynthesis protein
MKIYTVDSFTDKPFAGNPAAVCILERSIDVDLMLKIAREINFSETAFINVGEMDGTINLRWFTPTMEVDLCGHATLATAKILFEHGYIEKHKTISFDTRSGLLTSRMVGEKIELDFPSNKITQTPSDSIIESFINSSPRFVGVDGSWCLIEVEDEEALKKLKPNFELLRTHKQKIFTLTTKSTQPEYDFVSRCFGPAVGINEDPVTGSAHCYLAPYWSEKINKDVLIGMQVSERTGIVECELRPNSRILLRGHAQIMSEIKQSWQ